MPDQATLEALRDGFWPFYVMAVTAGCLSFVVRRKWCLARTVAALVLASLAQSAWEGAGYLQWWQHLAIDLPLFVLVTMPPRHYWQATMGGLIFAQLFLHCIWGLVPELAREHWLGAILIGYAKCVVLLLWSGGARVEALFDRFARSASGMVLGQAQEGRT